MKRIKRLFLIVMCLSLFTCSFYGCGEKNADAKEDENGGAKSSGDPYEDYIHAALEAVKDNAQLVDDSAASDAESAQPEEASNGRVIQIERGDSTEDTQPVYISSEVADDTEESESPDKTEEKKKTPETFDVGTGLIYIDGKYDETFRTNLLSTINDARTGLNYPAMTINTSLNTCANLRAKEITSFLSHMRPDGSMFYSLAPDYYKAEIITVDNATPKETFDAWMTDPISRNILFSKEYTSIGASNYVCNGLNCIVVSFGY